MVSLTRRNARNACSEGLFGSRRFAFLTVPSHPLARWTRDGLKVQFDLAAAIKAPAATNVPTA